MRPLALGVVLALAMGGLGLLCAYAAHRLRLRFDRWAHRWVRESYLRDAATLEAIAAEWRAEAARMEVEN